MNPAERMLFDIAAGMAYEIELVKTGVREPRAVAVRSVCARALRLAGFSTTETARMVGLTSHTSISTAVTRVIEGMYDGVVPNGDANQYAKDAVARMREGRSHETRAD